MGARGTRDTGTERAGSAIEPEETFLVSRGRMVYAGSGQRPKPVMTPKAASKYVVFDKTRPRPFGGLGTRVQILHLTQTKPSPGLVPAYLFAAHVKDDGNRCQYHLGTTMPSTRRNADVCLASWFRHSRSMVRPNAIAIDITMAWAIGHIRIAGESCCHWLPGILDRPPWLRRLAVWVPRIMQASI